MNLPALLFAKIKLFFTCCAMKQAKKNLNNAIHNTKTATDELNRLYERFLHKAKMQEEIAVSVKRHSAAHPERIFLRHVIDYGKTSVSDMADAALTRLDIERALVRHRLCDWGSVSNAQWCTNNYSAFHGQGEIRSRYHYCGGRYLWIITDLKQQLSKVCLEEEL